MQTREYCASFRVLHQKLAKQMAAQHLPVLPSVTILRPEQVKPLLKDVLPGIVRDAIEADVLNPTDRGGPS